MRGLPLVPRWGICLDKTNERLYRVTALCTCAIHVVALSGSLHGKHNIFGVTINHVSGDSTPHRGGRQPRVCARWRRQATTETQNPGSYVKKIRAPVRGDTTYKRLRHRKLY
jgi:hypothetical protein